MHELAPLIKDLAVILSVAGIVTLLFQKLKQPVVLGYLVAGVIVGPHTPPHALVSDIPNIKILSELGVIFLMFSLGLEFSFHKLKRVGFSAGISGIIEVACMLLLGIAAGKIFKWSFYESLFLGAALAISSTTIIIKALDELNLKKRRFAEIVFGILIVEDLLAILLLVGLSTIIATDSIISVNMISAAIKLVLVIGGWFLIGYFLVPTFFRGIMRYASEETLTVISIALCLFLVCVADYFHYSSALGAFIMGSILAETPLVHRIEQFTQPIRNIFAAVFFVSVGMLIDPHVIIDQWSIILIICLLTIVGKLVTTGIGAFLTGQSINSAIRIGFSMAQIGEFSFIIAGLGLALQATSNSLYPIIVAVSAITTFTTPYLIIASGYLSDKLDQKIPAKIKYILESYSTWIYRLLANSNESGNRKAFVRLIMNGIIVCIIFMLIELWAAPKIAVMWSTVWLSKVIGWLLAVLFSSPFILGMTQAFRVNTAMQENKRNNFILYLSWLFTALEITLLSMAYYDSWIITTVLLVCIGIFFRLLYQKIDRSYQWFERQFVRNIQNHEKTRRRYEELAPWDTHLIEVEVNRFSPLVGKALNELQLRQLLGINVVAIYRGAQSIFSPRGNAIIYPFDKLVLLGNDKQIESFNHEFIKENIEIADEDILENFGIKALVVDDKNELSGKTIRDSHLRERVHGLVVGIERRGERTLNPDSNTVLAVGDLLFVVGEHSRLNEI